MANYDFDLFVIGVGSGGVRAARMCAQYGARVATAEDRYMGGTCVNVGCVPKKLFVYASHYSEEYQQAEGFGWGTVAPEFNWSKLLDNKNREIARLNGIYKGLLDNAGVTHYDGRAKIVDDHHIVIGETVISTDKILIATGSWPLVPEFPGSEYVITSNEAFFLKDLPDHCLVVGGGYIAVEFAGIFHGLGVDTSLSYRGDLFLRNFDIDIRKTIQEELTKKQIDLRLESNVVSIAALDNERYLVTFREGGQLETDLILYATGREPAVRDIGIENVAVELRDNGSIVVDENFRTSVPNIFALGDVIGGMQLTPVAIEEAMCFASTQFLNKKKIMDYDNIATAVFCQPNVGTVGLTEDQAIKAGYQIDVYRSIFRPMKHTLSGSDEKFMMKLVVDRASDRVLGVHMVGAEAGEIVQGIAIAMKIGVTKDQFDATVGIHPTTAEEFVTMRETVSR
ncbi:MAG TPA: glutathione-disulfide reductase [Gammaproteobacteria bacterium]|nr:glutathione-disulfide reductase [Gammaproteobacteria bacterium]